MPYRTHHGGAQQGGIVGEAAADDVNRETLGG
jgi:hypothetical protein